MSLDRPDDDHLGVVLHAIGAELDLVPAPPSPHRRGAYVAAAVVVAAASVLAVAPARRTVADWFGFGRTEFRLDPQLTLPVGSQPRGSVAGAEPITPVAARRLLGGVLPPFADGELGEPDGWYRPIEGGVVAVWEEPGLALTLSPTNPRDAEIMMVKTVGTREQVVAIDDLGDGGVVVAGEHLVTSPQRSVSVGSVVIWRSANGTLIARLESIGATPDDDELVASAQELEVVLGASEPAAVEPDT